MKANVERNCVLNHQMNEYFIKASRSCWSVVPPFAPGHEHWERLRLPDKPELTGPPPSPLLSLSPLNKAFTLDERTCWRSGSTRELSCRR